MRMKFKYVKYWRDVEKINILLFLVAILNPRYKLEVVEFFIRDVIDDDMVEQFISILKHDIDALYNHYNNNNGQSSSAGGSSSRLTDSNSSVDDTHSRISTVLMRSYHQIRASRNIMQCKYKVEWYLLEDVEALSDTFHILTWWKVNSAKFLVLSRVARDMLVIPIITVISKSTFSTSNRVLDAYRSENFEGPHMHIELAKVKAY